ncbi:MAG TPA: acetate--CoA ligase family protein [Solirubrobacteraceae bacterium]|nr:acetate--CoA ligase family protein [Solirubrobacteraceae bacterium]
MTLTARRLDALFDPSSVAVVGASDDPRKWGNWLARGALRGEGHRPAYLINHRADGVLGRSAYSSLADLPDGADLVVIAVPAPAVASAVDGALACGARAIVVISAGSSEPDAALAERTRAAGAVLVGPNCLGVLDSGAELELVPNPLPAGSIGLISQSGNLALELALLAAPEGLGFSRFVSLGNQADVGAAELIAELAGHDETRLLALYVEDFRDGRQFARAAMLAAEAGKPVLALAIEHGDATTRAVRSHTGALASDGAVIDAACRAAGVQRVRTPREMIDAASALLRCTPARGRRVGVLADGGGHGSIAAGVAADAGLEVPHLSDAVNASLRDQLPAGAAVTNPVDLAGGAERDVHAFDRLTRELLRSDELDALLITGYFGGYGEYGEAVAAEELRTAALIGDAAAASARPVVVHTMYPHGPAAAALREAGVPVYESVERSADALRRLVVAGGQTPTAVPDLPPPAPAATTVDYESARALLADGGISFVAQRTVTSAAQALEAAGELGYPLVLKALGRLHKSDGGGVKLAIADDERLARIYDDFAGRLAATRCSLERMAPLADGLELLIGTRWDPRFGPVVLAGSGGIYAEVLHDTTVALAPVTEMHARTMLEELRCAPLLSGARRRSPLDIDAAAAALASLSRVAASHPELVELEINPLLVLPAGALALDARAVHT